MVARANGTRGAALPPNAWEKPALVTLVPHERALRLAAVLPPGTVLRQLQSCADLPAALKPSPTALVVDPLLIDPDALEVKQALSTLTATTPFIVYTSLTPEAIHRLLDLPSLARALLILAGVDDGPSALRRTFHSAGATFHRLLVLEELRACAGALPPEVAHGLSGLLSRPSGELTVRGLAKAARVSPRTLERRLADADAPSAKWLMRATRAFLAREMLRTSSLTVRQVADGVGYSRLGSLRDLLRWSFGSSPSSLRRGQSQRAGPRLAARRPAFR